MPQTPIKRGPGRPRKNPLPPAVDPELEALISGEGGDARKPPEMARLKDLTEVHYGVTQTWLAQAFHLDKKTVTRKLARCEPMRHEGSIKLYALHQAAPYLVKPQVDVAEYIATMNPKDLPPLLQEAYWGALIKRQKWEENAKMLWRSEDVLDVFGELAMSIKSRVQLWVEDLDRVHGITAAMRKQLTDEADNLLASIHELMVEAPANRQTKSSASQYDKVDVETEVDVDV